MRTIDKLLLERLALHPPQKLLDVGCGKGAFAMLAKANYPTMEVAGLDPDARALRIAKVQSIQRSLSIAWLQGDAEELPFPPETFGVVVSALTFHHISPVARSQVITEIYRVLKPGGSFLLVDAGKPRNVLEKLYLKAALLLEPPEAARYFADSAAGMVVSELTGAGLTIGPFAAPRMGVAFLLGRK